ncbi:MAG TPA: RDD family protein [Chitinophagaceae bacterium]|nr:RDD family protein [Chitinophagaceae bacterium]
METNQQHLFTDSEYQIVQASGGKRLVNYLIDRIVFLGLVFIAAMVIAIVSPQTIDSIDEENTGFNIVENLVYISLFVLYMFGIEAIFKGKTLGKLMTGTRAVNEDGSNITPKTALLRGLSRVVPFEVFSALGNPCYPWHDSWTKTYVIDEKRSNRPEEL